MGKVNLNFGFMLRFSEGEVDAIKSGRRDEVDVALMKGKIRDAIREAYEFPIWVHFRADPKLLRKAGEEIVEGHPILSFNLDEMSDNAFDAIKKLDISEEEMWWRKDDSTSRED